MTPSRLSAVAAVAFAFVAASCGGDGNSGPNFPDSVSTADAQEAAGNAAAFAATMVGQMNFGEPGVFLSAPPSLSAFAAAHGHPLPSVRPRFVLDPRHPSSMQTAAQLASAEGCDISMHGMVGLFSDFVDVNQNGIADDAGLRIVCTVTDSTTNPDSVVVHTETQELSIQERFGDLYGYTASTTLKNGFHDDHGNSSSFSVEVNEFLSILGGAASHRRSIRVLQDSMSAGDAGVTHWDAGTSWDGHFDPDGTIALGDPLPDGDLSFTGRTYYLDPLATDYSFTLATETPLAFDAACYASNSNPPYTAGIVTGHLNNNASSANFSATFTGCGTPPTIVVNGAYDEPVAVEGR
jgi:hypothetical protein